MTEIALMLYLTGIEKLDIDSLTFSCGTVSFTVLLTPGSFPYLPQLTNSVQAYTTAAAQKPGLLVKIFCLMTNKHKCDRQGAERLPPTDLKAFSVIDCLMELCSLHMVSASSV